MRRFGLIGKTLKHSFSKNYFSKKFTGEGITDCIYDNFEMASIDELPDLIGNTPGLEGLNITIPYKELVLPYLHKKDVQVKKIGACNCIRIKEGMLHGYNTDAHAFENSLASHLQSFHQCAIVLGSGGASKAVQSALNQLHIDFIVVSRNKKGNEIGYEDISPEMIRDHQVIINTTPLGMFPNMDEDPPIPYEGISTRHILFDLVYNPEKTKFLKQGEERGATIINGYEMLRLQAEESWRIWNGE